MGEQTIFQLLNPAMMLVFSVGFLVIYLNHRMLESAGWCALAYFSSAMGFTADFFRDFFEPVSISYVANIFYLMTGGVMTYALALRLDAKPPVKLCLAVAAAALAGVTWFWFGDDNIVGRTLVMHSSVGILFGFSLPILWQRRTGFIDKFIFWAMAIVVFQMLVRPSLMFLFVEMNFTQETYSTSLLIKTLHFTSTVAGLSIAMALFLSYGMNIIEELKESSLTDPLTDLFNRRGFESVVNLAIQDAELKNQPLSLIVSDIDNFKQVNDVYGHSVGDEVIKALAKVLIASCRQSDTAGRVGGEEFCILLPTANVDMANLVASTARAVFQQMEMSGPTAGQTFTASFGVAELMRGESYVSLFARADSALYEAKESGRNRVVVDKTLQDSRRFDGRAA